MKQKLSNKKWYTVMISLLLIWFLLTLTIGVFWLVLKEMKSIKVTWDYIKAYAWAESSQELALLEIKNKSFALSKKIENDLNEQSILLSSDYLDTSKYKAQKDVLISYFIDSKVEAYNWTIEWLDYHILPLFYVDDNWVDHKITALNFNINTSPKENLVWNILSNKTGISWIWEIWSSYSKTVKTDGEFEVSTTNANTFLSNPNNNNNFLILFNSSSNPINYFIKTTQEDEYFVKPIVDIISTWEVWNYRQNLKTTINIAEYLSFLKYSIYSP